jgi:hypothetical protein
MMATKTVKVKSGRKDNRVALWEQHKAHPKGEVFIAGETAVEAALTAAVSRGLNNGTLVEVGGSRAAPTKKGEEQGNQSTPPENKTPPDDKKE